MGDRSHLIKGLLMTVNIELKGKQAGIIVC